MLAVPHSRRSETYLHSFLGPSQSHIEKTSLLLDFLRRCEHSSGWENILLHSRHENIRELETLGGMDGHKGYLVGGILVILDINGTQEGNILEEITQCHDRKIFIIDGFHIHGRAVRKHFLLHFVAPVLHEALDAVEQFLDIGGTGLILNRIVLLKGGVEPASGGKFPCDGERILDRYGGIGLGNHRMEGQNPGHCSLLEP